MTNIEYGKKYYNSIALLEKWSYNMRFVFEHFLGKTFLHESIKRWEHANIRNIYAEVSNKPQHKYNTPEIDKSTDPVIIRKEFINKGRPFIIRNGASDWTAFNKWDFDFFKENYGNQEVILSFHKSLGDDIDSEPEISNLKAIIDGIDNGSKKYARFNPLLDYHPELLEDLDRKWLNILMKKRFKNHHVLFIGNQGTKTNIHNAGNENVFIQIRGTKRWLMWDHKATYILNPGVNRGPAKASTINPLDPDASLKDAYNSVPIYDFELNPGDILFIPSYLWHYVYNETPTIGIGVRWLEAFLSIRNNPLLALLEPFNTSPTMFKTLDWSKGFDFNKIILENLGKNNLK